MLSASRRELGRSGLEISALGLGTAAFGGPGWGYTWGAQDDSESLATIRRALELGINWIDTAPAYGHGHAEEIVRRGLEGIPKRDRPLLSTKWGLQWDGGVERVELRPDLVRKELEASLRRLGTDHIDLYQIHLLPEHIDASLEDSWAEMAKLVDEGNVRVIGVCNFDVAHLSQCEPIRHVESVQSILSLVHREATTTLIPWCRSNSTGVIAYRPLAGGLLTDGFAIGRVDRIDRADWRAGDPDFHPPLVQKHLALRDRLSTIAQRHGISVAGAALAWALACPGVSGAIVGARSPDQVDAWVKADAVRLRKEDLAALEETGTNSHAD